MEILTICIFVCATVLVIFAVILSCLKLKGEDKKEDEPQKKGVKCLSEEDIKNESNQSETAEENLEEKRLKKAFNFQPFLKDATTLCPSLKNVENPKEYYKVVYDEYFFYTDFEQLKTIVDDKNFKKNGFERLHNFLMQQDVEFDFNPKEEDVKKLQLALTKNGIDGIENEKIFELSAMKLFGFGCKQDLKAGFYYLQSAADFGNERAQKMVYPFSKAFGGDFDISKLAELWENLWLLKRGDKKALSSFASEVLLDYEAQYFTAKKICFDFAIKCAERAAEDEPEIWYKLASMLMYYKEFSGTDEQKNVPKYLKNAVEFSLADRESAQKDLEVWGND